MGLAVIGAALALARQRSVKIFIAVMATIGFLPPLVFTNLYIWHDYYPVANLVFLLLALAAAATALGDRYLKNFPLVYSVFLFLFVLSSLDRFAYGYAQVRTRVFTADNNRMLAVADYVKAHTRPEQIVIWYGLDWSSAMAFYTERKSLTVPDWPGLEQDTFEHLEKYLQQPAAVVVVCDNTRLREKTKEAVRKKFKPVKSEVVASCTVFLLPPAS
jgi:hypothetical protein